MRLDFMDEADWERESSAKAAKLKELLRIEFARHSRIESPWQCTTGDCPYLGKPTPHECSCYQDFQKAHVAAVKRALK